MDKDTIETIKHLSSVLEGIKYNIQQVESQLLYLVQQEELKQKLLHPEYELM